MSLERERNDDCIPTFSRTSISSGVSPQRMHSVRSVPAAIGTNERSGATVGDRQLRFDCPRNYDCDGILTPEIRPFPCRMAGRCGPRAFPAQARLRPRRQGGPIEIRSTLRRRRRSPSIPAADLHHLQDLRPRRVPERSRTGERSASSKPSETAKSWPEERQRMHRSRFRIESAIACRSGASGTDHPPSSNHGQ